MTTCLTDGSVSLVELIRCSVSDLRDNRTEYLSLGLRKSYVAEAGRTMIPDMLQNVWTELVPCNMFAEQPEGCRLSAFDATVY